MNKRMAQILKKSKVSVPSVGSHRAGGLPRLAQINGSVLLRDEYERAKAARLSDFPDRTGYESFINHIHLPYSGSSSSLKQCLTYTRALKQALQKLRPRRKFEIIVSLSDDGCVVRFHQIRPGEHWVSPNLETYADEAILVLLVGSVKLNSRG
jgi:hypothetical protein